jgi:hypothetical protein
MRITFYILMIVVIFTQMSHQHTTYLRTTRILALALLNTGLMMQTGSIWLALMKRQPNHMLKQLPLIHRYHRGGSIWGIPCIS